MAHINVEKRCLTLVALNSILIYSIGGACVESPLHPVKAMKTAEKYDVIKDVWTIIPKLVKKVAAPSVCEFRSSFIYAFGGVSKHRGNDFRTFMEGYHYEAEFTFCQVIQKFDVTQEKKGWSIVNLEKEEGWTKRAGSASVQKNPDEILIFGGSVDSSTGCQDSFIFNQKNNSIIGCETSHASQAPFFTRKVMISKSKVIFVITCALGELDIEEKQWTGDGNHI